MKEIENNSTEQQIITAAKQLFIEKGFAETNMSDIAAKAGINRPGLHYYFRTKEKMFEAVFSDIVHSFVPAIQDIIQQDIPITDRMAEVVNVYFETMQREPCLPIFILREIQRDTPHLINTIRKLDTVQYICTIQEILLSEMDKGNLKKISLEFVFNTFYGLLFFPFLLKPLTDAVFSDSGTTDFSNKLEQWKTHIISQMEYLLRPD